MADTSIHGEQVFRPLNVGIIAVISVASTVILLALVTLVALLCREKLKHRRLLADLEHHGIRARRLVAHRNAFNPTKSRRVLRRGLQTSANDRSAWEILQSQEDVNTLTTCPASHREEFANVQKPSSIFFPWSSRRRNPEHRSIPLEQLRAVRPKFEVDSAHDSIAVTDVQATEPKPYGISSNEQSSGVAVEAESGHENPRLHHNASLAGGSATPEESFRPKPLFSSCPPRSEAICPTKRRDRARTMGATIRPVIPSASLDKPHPTPPRLHTRSLSLGSLGSGRAPDAPMPPLPLNISKSNGAKVAAPSMIRTNSHLSDSSLDSVGSSLLAASPILNRSNSARSKSDLRHSWSNSLIAGPRMPMPNLNVQQRPVLTSRSQSYLSIKGNLERISTVSSAGLISREPSDASNQRPTRPTSLIETTSTASGSLEARSVVTFSRRSIGGRDTSRVASTPRRASRSLVTPNGSPAERRRNSVLQDVSGNHSVPTRQPSLTSTSRASSTRSSNGNPFHWDPSPMATTRPSAMKGSPTARKGHKRQNCVRIALPSRNPLARARSPSPSMAGIREESPNATMGDVDLMQAFDHNPKNSQLRPPSTSVFAPVLNPKTTSIRASLTASSPSLHLNNFSEDALACNQGAFSSDASSPDRNTTTYSSNSSLITIPAFPSPGKKIAYSNEPAPTFYFTRPSDEYDHENLADVPAEFKLLAQPLEATESPADADVSLTRSPVGFPVSTPFTVRAQVTLSHNDDLFPEPELEPISSPDTPITRHSTLPPVLEEPELLPLIEPDGATSTNNTDYQSKEGTTILSCDDDEIITSLLRPSSLYGPRSPPASPIRTSIARLRRMNSEAKESSGIQAARRYLRIGREASSPGIGVSESSTLSDANVFSSSHRNNSWNSIGAVLDRDNGDLPSSEHDIDDEDIHSSEISQQDIDDSIDGFAQYEPVCCSNNSPITRLSSPRNFDSNFAGANDPSTQSLMTTSNTSPMAINYSGKIFVGNQDSDQRQAWVPGVSFWDTNIGVIQDENEDPLISASANINMTSTTKSAVSRDVQKLVHAHIVTRKMNQVSEGAGDSGSATPVLNIQSPTPSSSIYSGRSPGGLSLYDQMGFLRT